MDYIEPSKKLAREKAIKTAIEALTKNRSSATLCQRNYVQKVKDFLSKREPYDSIEANRLSNETILRWEKFHDSIVQTRTPENLKVAYLCGPHPENDLRVFCAAGVLPENIWAFEADTKVHDEAVKNALSSEFPFIKIFKEKIDTFLECSPMRFDIIYLDFCGPLPSRDKKQKTLLAISRILARHALNSPGVLITNVSLPTEAGDAKGRKLIAKLVACYLYPKDFLEDPKNGIIEGPTVQGYTPDQWLSMVSNDLENYYGQFVTRLLMDHAGFISPYNNLPSSDKIVQKFFGKKHSFQDLMLCFTDEENAIDPTIGIVGNDEFPIIDLLITLNPKPNPNDEEFPRWINDDSDFKDFAKKFLSQLRTDQNIDKLIKDTFSLIFAMRGYNLNASLNNIIQKHEELKYYQFCDLVLPHQIIELLFQQVLVPYLVNIEKTQRWQYQAKETPMFLDVIILDECRYLYDWMPTIEMISSGFSNIERQLSYRFVLDAISKHHRWYNTEYFFGTAVIGTNHKNFDGKTLAPREKI